MKDTPKLRDKLAGAMIEGENAERLLKELDPVFESLQGIYLDALTNSVRLNAEEREITLNACKITALDDLYANIRGKAVTGRRAQKTATILEEAIAKHKAIEKHG